MSNLLKNGRNILVIYRLYHLQHRIFLLFYHSKYYYNISAHCTGLDPEKHKNLETTATFPVGNGDTISVTCRAGYSQLSAGDVMMTCIEGTQFSQQSLINCTGKFVKGTFHTLLLENSAVLFLLNMHDLVMICSLCFKLESSDILLF